MKNNPKSRREFLLKFFSDNPKSDSDLASLAPQDGQTDKIKMLTPDGKLVEVYSHVVKNCLSTSKASNKDILNWMEGGKNEK